MALPYLYSFLPSYYYSYCIAGFYCVRTLGRAYILQADLGEGANPDYIQGNARDGEVLVMGVTNPDLPSTLPTRIIPLIKWLSKGITENRIGVCDGSYSELWVV